MRRLYIKPTVRAIHLESIELLAGSGPLKTFSSSAAGDGYQTDDTPTWGGNGTGNNFK